MLSIIFEDENLLILDKPAGIAMHAGNMRGAEVTVADFVRSKVSDTDRDRPGIVHRLDKDTSGLVVIAKTNAAKLELQRQFKQRQVKKYYQAAVHGHPKLDHARIELPIGRHPKNPLRRSVRGSGRPAVSEYWTVEKTGDFSLLKIQIYTGRTHQIRVHMAHIGHPVLGDKTYGRSTPGLDRQFLHACELEFRHPETMQPMTFTSPLPPELAQFWYNAKQT